MNEKKLLLQITDITLLLMVTLGCSGIQPDSLTSTAIPPTSMPLATPTSAPLTVPTVRSYMISNHSDGSSQPVIHGDYVVWAHKAIPVQPLGTYRIDIYAYNLSTKQETLVASVEASDIYPQLAGNLVVWLEYPSFTGYRLDAEDAGEFHITNFQALPSQIRFDQGRLLYDRAFYGLSDRVLVWSDAETKDTYDILAYDLGLDERFRVTNDDHTQTWPAVGGSLVVWSDERNDQGDIYAYNLDTQEEYPIVTAPLTQTMPSTDGKHIVWIDCRDGNDGVYAYNLETQTEFPVIMEPGVRVFPGVWGDIVIWTEIDSDATYVYGYDLRINEKFEIAVNSVRPGDARIWSNVVVWTEYRAEEGIWVIYGATMEP